MAGRIGVAGPRHHGRWSMFASTLVGGRRPEPCVRCRDHDGPAPGRARDAAALAAHAAAGRAARRRATAGARRATGSSTSRCTGSRQASARSSWSPPGPTTAGSRSPSTSRSARSRSWRCGSAARTRSRSASSPAARRWSRALAGGPALVALFNVAIRGSRRAILAMAGLTLASTVDLPAALRRRRALQHADRARRADHRRRGRLGAVRPRPARARALAARARRARSRPSSASASSRPARPSDCASRARCTTSWRIASRC